MSWLLRQNQAFRGAKGPLLLVVLDGVGIGNGDASDAVVLARTPTLDGLIANSPSCILAAHGTSVGLPTDEDMGNSEVGHNALGCGRVYQQGALLVNNAIENGSLFHGATWQAIVARTVKNDSALHFLGLLSDGNVHSHMDHLIAMMKKAAAMRVPKIFVHILTDGRDVPGDSALMYVEQLEAAMVEVHQEGNSQCAIASGGGRMVLTMDRYEAEWGMVERGWKTHVEGQGRQFQSAREAIETYRQEDPSKNDQYLPPFVIAKNGAALGPILNGDAVINFNFRGDRAIEISRAFEDDSFSYFDRGEKPDVLYAGMMEYDGDTKVPSQYLVEPPAIDRTMSEFLVHNQVSQLAISETHKYGHVTFFWNGNRSGKFDDSLESYVEIPSFTEMCNRRPAMKAVEITDRLIQEMKSKQHRFLRVNYANGDMVGHTGDLAATITALEVLDAQLLRLKTVIETLEGVMVVTADHGNADEMYQHDKNGQIMEKNGVPLLKTSHTLNPVPFIIHGGGDVISIDPVRVKGAGIASVTATCLELLGFVPPDDLATSLLRFK